MQVFPLILMTVLHFGYGGAGSRGLDKKDETDSTFGGMQPTVSLWWTITYKLVIRLAT